MSSDISLSILKCSDLVSEMCFGLYGVLFYANLFTSLKTSNSSKSNFDTGEHELILGPKKGIT